MFSLDTRILIIDDSKTIRSLLKDILLNLGYSKIDEAENAEVGLEKMKTADGSKEAYGCIFSDWNLPGMSGLELLKIRNEDPRFKDVPFLIVTIEGERDYVLKAVSMGVSDFIVKPFSEATVKSKMKSVFNRRKTP